MNSISPPKQVMLWTDHTQDTTDQQGTTKRHQLHMTTTNHPARRLYHSFDTSSVSMEKLAFATDAGVH